MNKIAADKIAVDRAFETAQTPNTLAANAARSGLSCDPFPFARDVQDLAWNTRTGWQALVESPFTPILQLFPPAGGVVSVDLRQIAPGKWAVLHYGDLRLPLQVRRDASGVYARWDPAVTITSLPGVSPPGGLPPSENRENYDTLSRLAEQRHGTAMNQISHITYW